MPKRLIPTILTAATLSLAAAGCGGDDEPTPAPTPAEQPAETASLTKDELISQGDGICAEVNAAIGTIDGSTTIAESDKADQKADIYDGLADRLEQLGTPSDGDAPADVIAALRDLGSGSGAEGDLAALQSAATSYGFTDCAEAPSAPVATGAEAPPTDGSGIEPSTGDGTYTEPAPAEPAPAPAPSDGTGGVNPDAGSGTGGASPGDSGSSGGSGGSSGGIGPG